MFKDFCISISLFSSEKYFIGVRNVSHSVYRSGLARLRNARGKYFFRIILLSSSRTYSKNPVQRAKAKLCVVIGPLNFFNWAPTVDDLTDSGSCAFVVLRERVHQAHFVEVVKEQLCGKAATRECIRVNIEDLIVLDLSECVWEKLKKLFTSRSPELFVDDSRQEVFYIAIII